MALNGMTHTDGAHITLLPALTISTALTTTTPGTGGATGVKGLPGMWCLGVEAIFLYGAGGTSVRAWVQTSFDSGATWFDIMVFNFTTANKSLVYVNTIDPSTPVPVTTVPGDAALTTDAVVNGILGDRLRMKITTVGTYSGATSLAMFAVVK